MATQLSIRQLTAASGGDLTSPVFEGQAAAGTQTRKWTLTQMSTAGSFAVLGANTFTGLQTLPVGSAAATSLKFTGDNAGSGFYAPIADSIVWSFQGTPQTALLNNQYRLVSSLMLGWSSGGAVATTIDTSLSRASAGVAQLGTSANNALGSLNLTNLTATGTVDSAAYKAGGTSGVTAGPFTVISSIQVKNGLVTVLTGT